MTSGLKALGALSWWLCWAVGALSLAGRSNVAAQTRNDNPHGKIDVLCSTCHSPDSWKPVRIDKSFDHGQYRFALEGGHGSVTCSSCHPTLEFDKVGSSCVSCHQDIHRGELGVECAQCHNVRSFNDRAQQINHSLTRFPLDGAHRILDCRSCHTPGLAGTMTFRGAPTTCVACHQGDFNKTANPNHKTASFPTTCTACHTTTTWIGATFHHSTTAFPLTGAHQAVTCLSCHINGLYKGTPTTCVSCHLTDFNAGTNPNHTAAGFPTDCGSCHTTARWLGATFAHDAPYFRIYSGIHQGKWATCATCHANSATYKEFTCLTCHEHDKTSMDSKHLGRSGYSYTSAACLSCHPRV